MLSHSALSMQSRNWCFTINNPTDDDRADLNFDDPQWNHQVLFAVYMLEKGDEGTPHYQGYLELRSSRRIQYLKSRIPRAHLEPRRGTKEQAVLYCVKTWEALNGASSSAPSSEAENHSEQEDAATEIPTTTSSSAIHPIWFGLQQRPIDYCLSLMTKPRKKKKSEKLLTIKEMLQEGKTEEEIADYDFELWVRNYRAFREYKLMITPNRDHEVEVIVLQGPTGTGKSKWAKDNFADAYWKQRSIWWDGYMGQDTVVIDEFYGWIPFDTLLRICDRYPLLVETKGGQVNFVAKRIIITTNAVPSSWYKNVYFNSFVRRVNEWHVLPAWGEKQIYTDYSQAIAKFVNNE